MHGVQKVLSNNGFRIANCFCCLSQDAIWSLMVYLAHCRQELQQELENLQNSFSMTKTKTNIQDQDQHFMILDRDFHFSPRGASRPRPWSQGLHHCLLELKTDLSIIIKVYYILNFIKNSRFSIKQSINQSKNAPYM